MSNARKASNWDRLIELLGKEHDMFERILELCRQQSELLAQNKIEELEKPFGEVQKLREKINGLHQESNELMQSYVSSLPQGGGSADVDELIGNVKAVVAKCASLNNQNMKAIEMLTSEQSRKIDEQRAKREGIGGYSPSVTARPELFDKKT